MSKIIPTPIKGDGPCNRCGSDNIVWFTDSELWNLVMGGTDATDDPGGILCIHCFVTTAYLNGVDIKCWKLVSA